MPQSTGQDREFLQIPWAMQMSVLTEVLRARGRDVPPGYTVTLESVPEAERDAQGLPMFRAVLMPLAEPARVSEAVP